MTSVSALEDRASRRRRARRRLRFQRIGAAGALGLGAVAALAFAFGSHDRQPAQRPAPGLSAGQSPTSPARGGAAAGLLAAERLAGPTRFSERRIGTLPAPLEDPGAAVVGPRVVLAGGLTAQDTSSATVIVVRGASAKTSGALPAGQHDAPAAASVDRSTSSAAATGFASWITSCESIRSRER